MTKEQKAGGKGPIAPGKKDAVDQMISMKLKSFYDDIVEEGTPDRLLDLLEKLDAAERAAAARRET
ncbi:MULTISPECIES: NepR family anti-sigma factor [unclassified Ciceribacter]|uniref:NepR family anti-sigma factor n=1 Tax=unclassified Ciceribacter TaxID=2628820 RepID=UPI001FF01FEF|nr:MULTISPECIES: NepR family anti-sigma factor [unclassified Ciceribacter]